MRFSKLTKTSRLNESEIQRTFYDLKNRMNALEKNLNGPIEEVADKIYIVAFTAIHLMGKILYEHPEMKSEYDEERNHLITMLQKQK